MQHEDILPGDTEIIPQYPVSVSQTCRNKCTISQVLNGNAVHRKTIVPVATESPSRRSSQPSLIV